MTQSNVVNESLLSFNNPDEELYRRFPPNRSNDGCTYFQRDEQGRDSLRPMALTLPRCSVNRQSLSNAEDVINNCIPPKPHYGIAFITVDDARYTYTSSQGEDYICDVRYIPEGGNASHSEIQVFLKSTASDCASDLPRDIKKAIRTVLALRFQIYRFPDPQ